MSVLIYTFRSCPFRNDLSDAFIFGKLKNDLATFCTKMMDEKPEYVLGVANSRNKSCFESIAINQFNKTKKVSKDGAPMFKLFVPRKIFRKSTSKTDSFCNWSAYKIASFIEKNSLDTKVIFLHLDKKDLGKLQELINSL